MGWADADAGVDDGDVRREGEDGGGDGGVVVVGGVEGGRGEADAGGAVGVYDRGACVGSSRHGLTGKRWLKGDKKERVRDIVLWTVFILGRLRACFQSYSTCIGIALYHMYHERRRVRLKIPASSQMYVVRP